MLSQPLIKLLCVSTWFQVVWLMAVWGNAQLQWLTVICVAATVSFALISARFPFKPAMGLWVTGIVLDTLNQATGVLVFPTSHLPLWLISLWAIFIWYAHFIAPLVSQYPLAIVSIIGGIAGGASYLAGFKLGAVTFHYSLSTTLVILFFEWTLFIYMILKVLKHEEGKLAE
ncbi:DUF2878 domain-containing protein [Vibrio intestinalis]|uniref:DUF2878 domain-containing protein n=1 Tax=Vibrio intestinalis TaxID=2933291 RepID=UPI0021A5888A|nr:DUF2878 domain-containing protein [Vibrio intestinalis]